MIHGRPHTLEELWIIMDLYLVLHIHLVSLLKYRLYSHKTFGVLVLYSYLKNVRMSFISNKNRDLIGWFWGMSTNSRFVEILGSFMTIKTCSCTNFQAYLLEQVLSLGGIWLVFDFINFRCANWFWIKLIY